MIKCHLSRLMGERKLKIADVARDTGINRGTLTRLYYETAERIELEVLDQLCEYFQIDISDLAPIVTHVRQFAVQVVAHHVRQGDVQRDQQHNDDGTNP